MIKKALKTLALYPRLRVLLLLVGIVFSFVVVVNLFSVPPEEAYSQVKDSSLAAPKVRLTESSLAGTDRYNSLKQQDDSQRVDKTVRSGQSYFSDVFEEAKIANKKAESAQAQPETYYRERRQENEQEEAPKRMAESSSAEAQALMQAQANYVSSVKASLRTHATTVLGELVNTPNMSTERVERRSDVAQSGFGRSSLGGSVMIKAGTIHYAVLETALNSDHAGTPVLATIVSGRFKGARLMGRFARAEDALVIQFYGMSMDSMPSQLSINAFAIDGETADTALASSVNRHYLTRYGSLFAASFLQGFGSAFERFRAQCGNNSTNCTVNGVPETRITIEEAKYRGLGQIGQNMAGEVIQNFSRAPTVKLAQGSGLGILYMSDVNSATTVKADEIGGLPTALAKEKAADDAQSSSGAS